MLTVLCFGRWLQHARCFMLREVGATCLLFHAFGGGYNTLAVYASGGGYKLTVTHILQVHWTLLQYGPHSLQCSSITIACCITQNVQQSFDWTLLLFPVLSDRQRLQPQLDDSHRDSGRWQLLGSRELFQLVHMPERQVRWVLLSLGKLLLHSA